MKLTITYIPVSVEDRLPEDNGSQTANYVYTDNGIMWNQPQNKLWYYPGQSIANKPQPTVWLEKKDSVFVLTKEELEKLLNNTFFAGYQSASDDDKPDSVEYINKLLNNV